MTAQQRGRGGHLCKNILRREGDDDGFFRSAVHEIHPVFPSSFLQKRKTSLLSEFGELCVLMPKDCRGKLKPARIYQAVF